MNLENVATTMRELIVQLHRGNGAQAQKMVDGITVVLKGILQSGGDPASFPLQRAQQTMFAIDEARILLTERDFGGAATAARDAVKEWTQKPVAEERV